LPRLRAQLRSPAVNSKAYKGRGRVLNLYYPYLCSSFATPKTVLTVDSYLTSMQNIMEKL
jgi:hypothetical protein